MELILQIPAQKETANVPRLMVLSGLDFEQNVVAEARDSKIPARLIFPKENFPWNQFLQKLAVAWKLSRNDAIPPEFRLRRKLPDAFEDVIPKLSDKESLKLLERLGQARFFSAFSKFAE